MIADLFRTRFWAAWLVGVAAGYGAVPEAPQRGFEQNVGQADREVLFALDEQIFYRNKVQLTPALSVQFVDANQAATVEGKNPVAFPLNLYLGPDRSRWRENVPHFSTIRYAQVYPGIDAEWNTGIGLPTVRIVVAPGANPQQLLLRLQGGQKLEWTVSGHSITVWSPGHLSLDQLVAYQPAGGSRAEIAVRFIQVDGSSFRPIVGMYDLALPLVIEFGRLYYGYLSRSAQPGYDDTVAMTGAGYSRGFLAKVSQSGHPVFLSMFSGSAPSQLALGRDGSYTVEMGPGGWVGRFDSNGRLRAATITGGGISALAVDPEGSVYFATSAYIAKWVPGNAQFSFAAPVPRVVSLSTNAAGRLAFAARQFEGEPNQPTTPGAFKNRFGGPWDLYVGALDRLSGKIQMATYVPTIGPTPSTSWPNSAVALAPGGEVWIASEFRSYESGGGDGYTLVAVSADGSRVFHSESVAAFPHVAFDRLGNVLVALSTYWPNLATSPNAPRRSGCESYFNLYLRTLGPDGSFLDATYLLGAGRIHTFEGLDRFFLDTLERVDTNRPADPGIACVIHTASRRSRTRVAPGGLNTLVGNRLGPLEQANAALDGSGRLPLELAGVQVLVNQVPVPLVSVQQGLVTFYIPEDTPGGSAEVEVRSRGALITSTTLSIAAVPDFAVLTADGAGRGLAAALNQNGTVNGPNNPARWGSVVSIFGTGPLPRPVPVSVTGRDTVEYAGPAPGLVPGVNQINLRLADNTYLLPGGWVLLRPAAGSPPDPPTIIYVAP